MRIHPNMQVPDSSLVAQAFRDPWGSSKTGTERLEDWKTSSEGPIGFGALEVEAIRIDDQVWALLNIRSAQVRPSSKGRPFGHTAEYELARRR